MPDLQTINTFAFKNVLIYGSLQIHKRALGHKDTQEETPSRKTDLENVFVIEKLVYEMGI